jgi:hypothetical protein
MFRLVTVWGDGRRTVEESNFDTLHDEIKVNLAHAVEINTSVKMTFEGWDKEAVYELTVTGMGW